MRYLEHYIVEFSWYYYKISHNETSMFYDKLLYPMNFIINEKYIVWLQKVNVIDILEIGISYLIDKKHSYLRKWVNNQYLDLQK